MLYRERLVDKLLRLRELRTSKPLNSGNVSAIRVIDLQLN